MKKTNTNTNKFLGIKDRFYNLFAIFGVLAMYSWIGWKVMSNSIHSCIYIITYRRYGYMYSSNLNGDFADVLIGNYGREFLVNFVGVGIWFLLTILLIWGIAYGYHCIMKKIVMSIMARRKGAKERARRHIEVKRHDRPEER